MKNQIQNQVKSICLFLKDHIWLIVFYVIFLSFLFLYEKIGGFKKDKWYFFFLAVLFFIFLLLYRYLRTKRLYDILSYDSLSLENSTRLTDYRIMNEKAVIEEQFKRLINKWIELEQEKENVYKQEKTTYRLLINQWIHQMKTPLSVIRLISEDKKQEKVFRDILLEEERLNYLLTQVLNMTKLEEAKQDLKIEKVNLKKVCQQTINEMKNLFIQKGIYPSLEIEDELYVYTDKKWIQFVLYQFLSNSLKYSKAGTKIIVRTRVTLEGTELEVEDMGYGISKSDLPYIFDLFYTGKDATNRGESTGLGLYMVKQILGYLEHGIEVQSIEGAGTLVKIVFGRI